MKCPNCNSENYVRNGMAHGLQRFLCKEKNCGYTYTVTTKAGEISLKRKSDIIAEFALRIHRQDKDLRFRAFAEEHHISHSTLIKWLDRYEDFKGSNPEYKNASVHKICKLAFKKKAS